jgi:Fic family protein
LAEIDTLLSGLRTESFRSRDDQGVGGYADQMVIIFESLPEIALSEPHILQLHGVLLRPSTKDQRHRGRYKAMPNHVEAFDGDGHSLGVVFETASPFATPRLMTELLDETNTALKGEEYHPLLVIGAFVLRFLTIHPFQDGNGRLSRALTTLLLLRAGYAYVPYSSLERVVEENKDGYYRALRRSQRRGGEEPGDWLGFFLLCLRRQTETLAVKIENERLMDPMPPLSAAILNLVREHGRVTVASVAGATSTSRNTVKNHLTKLIDAGALVRHGRGRGTWYSLR